MIETIDILRWLHVIGACVLLGTGAGIAFFMLMANRTGQPEIIAATARVVIIADYVFTTPSVIAQPLTGYLLAREIGWDFSESWIILSLGLYMLIGCFWLPVVVIQHRLFRLARTAAETSSSLPVTYRRLYRSWIALGFPAFTGVLAILWLMLARPVLW